MVIVRACWVAMLGVGLLVCGTAIAAGTATVQPGDEQVRISGESGAESELRTVRFNLAPVKDQPAPVLSFAPSHLTLQSQDVVDKPLIDSSHVKIASPEGRAQEVDRAAFAVSVTALPNRSGTYAGTIEVYVDGKKSTPLTLQVRVIPASSATLAMEPARLDVALITAGGEVLAGRPKRTTRIVSAPALPAGATIAAFTHTGLTPVLGRGEFPPQALRITPASGSDSSNTFVVSVDASGAAPGKYAGTARFRIAGTDRWLTLPIEVSVATGPAFVLFLVALGVALGQFVRYMTERGNRIVEISARYDRWVASFSALAPALQTLLQARLQFLQGLVAAGDYEALDTALTQEELRVRLAVRTAALRTLAQQRNKQPEIEQLDVLLLTLPAVEQLQNFSTTLDDLEKRLQQVGAIQDTSQSARQTTPGAGLFASPRLVALLRYGRRLLPALTVLLLAFVGFETLYVNGPTTFGAAALTDYLSAIVWGLSADVAARTLSALGRTAPAR